VPLALAVEGESPYGEVDDYRNDIAALQGGGLLLMYDRADTPGEAPALSQDGAVSAQ